MIPFFLIPKLDNIQIFIFQLIHSLIHLGIIVLMLYLAFFILFREKHKIDMKGILKTALIIEIADIIIAFSSIFLLIGGGLSIVYSFIFYIFVELGILYLRYYKKDDFSKIKVVFLYDLSCIPASLISIFLTDAIFQLMGIEAFIFIYQLG